MRNDDTTVQSPPPAGYDDGTIDAFLLELGVRKRLQGSDAARMGLLLVECGLAQEAYGAALRGLQRRHRLTMRRRCRGVRRAA